MVVLTKQRRSGRSGGIGLNVGAVNVNEHFPKHTEFVELELDHLSIVCTLGQPFWADEPEIHDHRLSSWLEAKHNSGKLGAQPSPIAMIPCGPSKYRLQPIQDAEPIAAAPRSAIPVTQLASRVAAVMPTVVPSLNRRKYTAGYTPERRRVARLNNDEPTSTSAND